MFASISENQITKYKDIIFSFTHDFDKNWSPDNSILLYGHLHFWCKPEQMTLAASMKKGAYNVGVDFHNFCPVSIENIYQKVLADFEMIAA